jgi:hypothetical protein
MKPATENWSRFAPEFYQEGSLRDIYVFNAQLEDWNKVIRFIVGRYRIAFSGAWTQTEFPQQISCLFPEGPDSELTTRTVDVAGVRVHCHFFTEEETEFDLNPGEVVDPVRLGSVFEFMQGLASAVSKDSVLTPENMPEIVIFRCRPGLGTIEHTPCGGLS